MAPESTLKEIEVEAILADGEGGVVDGGGAGGLREVDDEEARWSRQNLESGECRYFAASVYVSNCLGSHSCSESQKQKTKFKNQTFVNDVSSLEEYELEEIIKNCLIIA